MKFTIDYTIGDSKEAYCVAETRLASNGRAIKGYGRTWAEAKADLIERMRLLSEIPPSQEAEVPSSDVLLELNQ